MSKQDMELHDALIRTDFECFLHRCLMTLNPATPYSPNWHIRAIIHQLERTRRGEINRLIVNAPPRYLKSLIVSVAWPAFLLGHRPWYRIFAISYGGELSAKHAMDFRPIVESDRADDRRDGLAPRQSEARRIMPRPVIGSGRAVSGRVGLTSVAATRPSRPRNAHSVAPGHHISMT